MTRLRIATRESALAMWQARHVQSLLADAHPALGTELLPMTTSGDQMLDLSLASAGGKGLFLKELERAILDGRADIAVHSMKDVPVDLPDGLCISTALQRADPFDALVSNDFASIDALPPGARVGTSSQRRQAQLAALRPDLDIHPLRGNVQTRLRKLDDGEYHAIILAVAGLQRLELDDRIRARLGPEQCLPAIGQGIIGIECRENDADTRALLAAIEHADTRRCLDAERALNAALEGSCHSPIAAFAELEGNAGAGNRQAVATLTLRAMVGLTDGSRILRQQHSGPADQASAIGAQLAERMLEQGAGELLAVADGGERTGE